MAGALTASMEDYLESILRLEQREEGAHVKDIAEDLGVKMPSVTGALHSLAERKLIKYRPYGPVKLTNRGREAAEQVRGRHRLLTSFFGTILGLDARLADENACRIEHALGERALERLTRYMEFSESCVHGGCQWDGEFGQFCKRKDAGQPQRSRK